MLFFDPGDLIGSGPLRVNARPNKALVHPSVFQARGVDRCESTLASSLQIRTGSCIPQELLFFDLSTMTVSDFRRSLSSIHF